MTSTDIATPQPAAFLAVLDALRDVRTTIARMEALELALYAACGDYAARTSPAHPELADVEQDITFRSTAMEVGAALHVSDRTAAGRITSAMTISEDFPQSLQALVEGSISSGHLRVIVEAGQHLSDSAARADYQARILPIAAEETVARTKSIARVIASRIEPEVVETRLHTAVCARSVRVIDLEDGLSHLVALLPSVLAHGIHDRLTQAANIVKRGERRAAQAEQIAPHGCDQPVRRIDEIRADLLADLLLTGSPSEDQIPAYARDGIDLGAIRAHVQIVVTADGLTGDAASPAILTGCGPIPMDQAQVIAAQTPTWDRLSIDPARRSLLGVETYRPTAELRRYLRAFDERCRQPGCRRPAFRCDADHAHDAALGGPTHIDNLSPECRSHHVVKHADGWILRRLPDGTMLWTSKHGRTYPDVARPSVAFMITGPLPTSEPVPF